MRIFPDRSDMLQALRCYRDQATILRMKRLADDADELLQDILDGGLDWPHAVPAVTNLIHAVQQSAPKLLTDQRKNR